MQTSLFTIGHGTRKIEEFLSLLKKYNVSTLVDVRTLPYSRFNPQYNQKALSQTLALDNIQYVFMGDSLGGRPKDPAFYTNNKISYDLLKESPLFKKGLQELVEKFATHEITAIMCSERKPEECHRSMLIGKQLIQCNVDVIHIDEKGNLRDQQSLGLLL